MELKGKDIHQSILSEKLIYQKDFDFYLSWISQFVGHLFMIVVITIFVFTESYSNSDEMLILFLIAPIFWIFSLVNLYRLLTEERLKRIITENTEEENRKMVLKFISENDLSFKETSGNLIVAEYNIFGMDQKKNNSTIFIFLDNSTVLFAVLSDRWRIGRTPVILTYWWYLIKLKRWIKRGKPILNSES